MLHIFSSRSRALTVGSWLALAIILSVVGGNISNWVYIYGRHIPTQDVFRDYGIALAWAVLLGLSIFAWPVPTRDKLALLWAWAAKCAVALGFMLIYEGEYGLDSYFYFDESQQKAVLPWYWSDLGPSNELIIRFCSLHNRLLPASYHAVKITFAMIGLVAVYVFYRAAVVYLKEENLRIFYFVALFPSVLFWSSILGKDPLVLLGIALYAYGVMGFYRKRQWRYVLVLAVGVAAAMTIRPWLGPILLAPTTVFAVRGLRDAVTRAVFTVMLITGTWYSTTMLQQTFGIEGKEDVVRLTGSISQSWNYGGSAARVNELNSFVQMAANLPYGAFTALFRPLPREIPSFFGYLAGLENLLLLILLGRAVMRTRWRELKDPGLLWAIFCVLTWSAAYSVISPQNLGSAVRFKLQILPILLYLVLYLGRNRLLDVPMRDPGPQPCAGR